eukprot:Skav210574  [mRNA]  locus=scaffold2317:179659:180669:+ [translate_table: standard]
MTSGRLVRRRCALCVLWALLGFVPAVTWLAPRVPRVPRRAAETVSPGVEEESLLPELLELAESGGASLQERLEEVFAKVSPDDLASLRMKVSDPSAPDHAAAQRLGDAIQVAMTRRLTDAKNVLEELIQKADGDVNLKIRKMLKAVESPLPILMVLQLNIAEAQERADGERLQVLMHISTVMQEELEKKASRVRGMLNKLLRIEDENIRNNILRDQLTPVEVAGAPAGGTPLMAAMVPPDRLAPAIASLVSEVDRQMVAVLGPDDDGRYETMERIRQVAKQARMIIGEVYGQGVMDTFSADLTPAFHTLMSYKARNRPDAGETSKEPQSEPESEPE